MLVGQMCIILLSTASSIVRVQTPQKHPHNALLFDRWSGSNCALSSLSLPPQHIPPVPSVFSGGLSLFRSLLKRRCR